MAQAMAQQLNTLKNNFKAAGLDMKTALGRGLTSAIMIVEKDAKVRLTRGGQVSTGLLRASVTHRLIEMNGYPMAQAGTNVEYAMDVELGSSPHLVPIANLIKWAKRKGLDEESAYAIQRHIEQYGTYPHPFLIPALLSNKEAIFRAIAAPMRSELAKSKVPGAT